VYIATEYKIPNEEVEMKYSKELVQAQEAWREYNFKGEGMVVGIIDSGIDPSHKDMILTDSSTAKLTQDEVDSDISEFDLPGQFWNEKVPYGWNYMDNNEDILDDDVDTGMHGMHVAGTVAANGDEETGGIKGVAPEAQLLALRVFGEGVPSTYGDIYIKAIDDALKLGADVLNMSLGSTAGFVDADSPEQQAVKRAVDNGVVMSISAGNSALFADGYFYPYASNPDYGVVGSPSVSYDSISV
ncbi:S8 family serine peptidase, partial [Aeromonas veronii]|nr:S8 family serine peptidase [Aeromonas veronii]